MTVCSLTTLVQDTVFTVTFYVKLSLFTVALVPAQTVPVSRTIRTVYKSVNIS